MAARKRLLSGHVRTPLAVDVAFAAQLQSHLRKRLELHTKIAQARLNIALMEAGLQQLPDASHETDAETAADLDETKIEQISQLVLLKHLTPEDTVMLLRGQCPKDPRPNKALFPEELARLLHGYSHCDTLIAVASAGFTIPTRAIASAKPAHPKNHNSAERHSRTVRRHLAEGQARNEYAFFTDAVLARWTHAGHDIRLSPLGLVPKNNASLDVDGRVIHDLSAPDKAAVNDLTNKDLLPDVRWRRISEVASRDVKSAFRHLRVAACDAKWLGARVPGSSHWGLDLSGPFGWCGSPPFYVVFGRAISFLPFWALEWMDDHILIELVTQPDSETVPARATAAETALRLGMMAVLGPTSINESKFKEWTPNLHALGLIWHLNEATVSMPEDKIARASARVDALLIRGRATKTTLLQVLGVAVNATPFKTFTLPDLARRDLELFQAILAQTNFAHVPAAIFDRSSEPGLHLYMDASDEGLVVLDLAHRRYIQLFFDQSEREMIRAVSGNSSGTEAPDTAFFSINVREHLSLCLAVSIWARAWSTLDKGTLHLAASNVYAQELNRHLALAQAVNRLYVTAGHMAGARNEMADCGSRSLAEPFKSRWLQFSHGWEACPVPANIRTHDRYKAAWEQWRVWRGHRRQSPWLPKEEREQTDELVQYVLHLRDGGNSAATIRSKLCGIAWRHQRHGGYTVALAPDHRLVLRGMERDDGATRRMEPVTAAMLWHLRAGLNFDDPQQRSLWGATLLGFFFLLRKSEYLHEGSKPAKHGLCVRDIRFTTAWEEVATSEDQVHEVHIKLTSSKTDQRRGGVTLRLSRSGSFWLCPIPAIWELRRIAIAAGAKADEPLCTTLAPDGTRVAINESQVKALLRDTARRMDKDPSAYSTHSLRSGGATALFKGGATDLAIQKFGRWRSDAFKSYAHIDDVEIAQLDFDAY
ncbi:hypothetical protein SPRG_14668 [Saprolegnia parasitica CBS 223.65]|uniref:Tyr recombinase domain-containing protein n=1 Tax=Saprolegnia parasitica (strain CBS 223.65) TaxID=695850 RepID=A0A067BZS6_SAPPC|nr:hypothetical protein SPRG_14668 [Saprolegnia parasitica CBS 223.65]KDO19806.1 hypothetical protein SPRG_14668 [Saprolegnia parasitica CBS 223.65]|eukprot:XP_012209465.1 hypothetical protein SPRG_14668 [Saprolegnia parasitica CBS 223.65]